MYSPLISGHTHEVYTANENSCKRRLHAVQAKPHTCMQGYCEGANSFRLRMHVWRSTVKLVCHEWMHWRHSSLHPTGEYPPTLHASWTCRPALLPTDAWSAQVEYSRVEWDSRLSQCSEDNMTMQVRMHNTRYVRTLRLQNSMYVQYVMILGWTESHVRTYIRTMHAYVHTHYNRHYMYVQYVCACKHVYAMYVHTRRVYKRTWTTLSSQ